MSILTFEGIVDHGQIRLPAHVRLPEKAKVYVLVPDAQTEATARIESPRLARPSKPPTSTWRFPKPMPAYDAQRFSPPAPLAQVTCKNPDSGAICTDVPMLIDTGADVSLLPHEILKRLALIAAPDRRYELVGFDGSVSTAPVVQAVIVFCGRTFRGQYLLIEQEYGILGRNILNAVPLTLDGPHLLWGEHTPK